MTAKIIDGKEIAKKMRAELCAQAKKFESEKGRKIGLAVVLVGENPASEVYVRNKQKACEEANIASYLHKLPEKTCADELATLIGALNKDKTIDGILVQLPLPKNINEREILATIDPSKDVDGFHVENAGALFLGEPCLTACTPSGCIELIKEAGINLSGKHAVVIGRSNIVGKPLALLLLNENCTVTITHSRTQNLADITRQADILIAAIGKREFVTGDMIKPGAIIIDVGINRHEGKLYGDVNFEQASKVASHITPVPGGVGPMTIAMLLSNTIKAATANPKQQKFKCG